MKNLISFFLLMKCLKTKNPFKIIKTLNENQRTVRGFDAYIWIILKSYYRSFVRFKTKIFNKKKKIFFVQFLRHFNSPSNNKLDLAD